MHRASASPVASYARNPAALRTSSSCSQSADRARTIERGFDYLFNGCNIERTAFIGALDHGPFPIHEGVIDEEISELAAEAGVLLMHDG
jgi:hypothetical protein